MSHFLITGGAGYIGSVLVPILLGNRHKVTVIDQFYFGKEALPSHNNLSCIQTDSRDITLGNLVGIDVVVDLAAMSNDPCGETFEDLTWQTNYKARIRTAKLAKKAGVKRYILPSSCSVYGFKDGFVSELSESNPLTTYASANLAAEKSIIPLASEQFCVTVLRLSTVFGLSPRMRLDLVVNSMTYNAITSGKITIHGCGSQYRPLVHVRDVAKAIETISSSPEDIINGETYNIGGKEPNYQIKEIAASIKQQIKKNGKDVRINFHGPEDMRSYRVSFEKIYRHTGWKPTENINAEVARMARHFIKIGPKSDQRCHTLNWYKKIFSEQL